MYQRDYLLRLIEQITVAIGSTVFKLRKEKKHEEALDAVGELYNKLSLPGRKIIAGLSAEELVRMLTQQGVLQTDKVVLAAALLKEEAAIYEEMGKKDTSRSYQLKSLYLYLVANQAEPNESAHKFIAELLNNVDTAELDLDAQRLLIPYFEASGSFSRAEDLLFKLLEMKHDDTLRQEGIAMYERLLQLSDAELEAGNLPRKEVQDALNELS